MTTILICTRKGGEHTWQDNRKPQQQETQTQQLGFM